MTNDAKPGAGKGGSSPAASDGNGGGRDWSDTLFLPKTDFPMRAGLPQTEPKLIERWARIRLYERLRAAGKGRDRFTLHDGPPYANGNIHIGHALNKILKDLVTRSQQMLGFDSNYVPGWDCHGLPIEWKIEEDYMAKGKAKPNLADPAAMKAFRAECRAFAEHWMAVQKEEFKRLGVEGDWEHPYTTMTFPAEAQIARELMKFAETGQLYRGSKPVMWSVVEKTALAEAEIEYQDFTSDQVWVKFPVRDAPTPPHMSADDVLLLSDASVVIWTTTPWTIPGNRAISFNSKIEYGIYEVTNAPPSNWLAKDDVVILAKKLAPDVMKAAKLAPSDFRLVKDIDGKALAQLTCAHPLRGYFPTSSLPPTLPLPPKGGGKEDGAGGRPGVAASDDGRSGVRHVASPSASPPPPGGGRAGVGVTSEPYAFDVPLLDGDHVTDDTGTGFVHTAPGHGREDFDIWTSAPVTQMLRQRGISTDIPYTVDENGAFTTDAPGFTGERVITDKGEKGRANEAVITALAEAGMMVARGRLKHQYPHSWRSKKPVIFRNTPQWFIHMDQPIPHLEAISRKMQAAATSALGHNQPLARTLREVSLRSIRETEWVPASGENRIRGMIEAKPDWVISRQRAWGVPITVFVRKGTNEVLVDATVNRRIYEAMNKEGADAWFADADGARFLRPDHDPAGFEKINDVLDVWFDSGSTHTYVLEDRLHFPGLYGFKRKVDGGRDRVMYLEGSDQHRGWFHSSLIESSGTRGHAPFDVVLTHGFCLDEKGQKMSKSVGNVVAPQDVIKTSGADIMRLWVAASDYADDLRIGPEILKGFVDNYRKIRNTLRWMLGTLGHYDSVASGRLSAGESEATSKAVPELERLMLHRLAELDGIIRKAYAEYDYKKVVAQLAQFMNTELSAFYFDIRKDALYCEAPSSPKRRAALACVEHIFRCVTVWLAPILAFTAEEAWLARYGDDGERSVHLELFPAIPAEWRDDALDAKWAQIRRVRAGVTGALELERAAKRIGSSLEAAPVVHVADAELRALIASVDLAEVCITSGISISAAPAPAGAFVAADIAGVAVVPGLAKGRKCARSWRYTADVGSDRDYPDLCARDAAAVRELAAMGRMA